MITTPLTEIHEFYLTWQDDPCDDCTHWIGVI
jgi:hypothetical protein